MMFSPIHHAHPHRQPDVDTAVYHEPEKNGESLVRTQNRMMHLAHFDTKGGEPTFVRIARTAAMRS